MANLKSVTNIPAEQLEGTVTGKSRGMWSGLNWMALHGVKLGSTVLFPAIVMLVTYFLVPRLGVPGYQDRIDLSKLGADPWIFAALLGTGVIMMVWFWANIRIVQNMYTTVNELKHEVNVSIWMGYAVMFVGGWMIGKHGSLYWWFVVPAAFQVFDGIGSAITALNNAAQKPIVQQTSKA